MKKPILIELLLCNQVLHSEMCMFLPSYLILTTTLEVTIILTNKFYVIINIIKVLNELSKLI